MEDFLYAEVVTKEKDANVSKLEISKASPKKMQAERNRGHPDKEDRKRTLDPFENLCNYIKRSTHFIQRLTNRYTSRFLKKKKEEKSKKLHGKGLQSK